MPYIERLLMVNIIASIIQSVNMLAIVNDKQVDRIEPE